MATTVPRLTYDELELRREAPEHERNRLELIDGEVVVTPAPETGHQLVSMSLAAALDRFVRPARLGWVLAAPIDVRLSDTNVVQPDVCFVSREQRDIIIRRGLDGPPDLLVEILSPATRGRDLGAKRELYGRFGVPEYWIVDPRSRSVEVLTLRDGAYAPLAIEGGVVRSAALPGFAMPLAELFDLD